MKFTSMHTHTILDDGEDDVETMCRAAYEKKLYAVGFSAHAPITKKTGIESWWNLKDNLVNQYVDQVLLAKNRWKGKLEVFLGFEVDYIKGLRSAIDSDIKAINPDYLIGSVHYVIPDNGAEIFTVDGSIEEFEKGVKEGFNGDVQALMHYYYNAVAEMIALGGFEILGHADLIKKNCQNKNYWSKESEVCRQREIALCAAEAGITVEVNTGGINRGKIRDVYPSLSFLRLFRENNVPAIITADAHRTADIDGNYETAIQTLSNAGYKEHVIFSKYLKENCIFQKEKIIIL
jgi:histidinol-phosphatase (PHP family)